MIVTIHQPDFFPWLGFFDRWKQSDLYIVLDDVQFLRRGWHHRDKIKTVEGVQWLTVPVIKKHRYTQQIREVMLDSTQDWRRKHLRMIRMVYGQSPNFDDIYPWLEHIYQQEHESLLDLNMTLLKACASLLEITTPFQYASTFHIHASGTQRLVELVKAVQGNIYLTGNGSRAYLDETAFQKEQITVRWQEFKHPIYPQLYGDFQPGLSVLDFLMMTPTSLPGLELSRVEAKDVDPC